MKKEFTKYLKEIGMSNTLCKRVEEIYEFYKEVCPEEITGIFVTDYIQLRVSREYENLWFFSSNYCMEAKDFQIEDDFDMETIQNRVNHWEIKKENYDFKKAIGKSRIHLEVGLDVTRGCEFKASKENCDHLKKIFLKYIVPNLKE